jgi:hypothetical protein
MLLLRFCLRCEALGQPANILLFARSFDAGITTAPERAHAVDYGPLGHAAEAVLAAGVIESNGAIEGEVRWHR